MLLDSANVKTETNCNVQGHTFSIKASPVAFDILSSKLYSNPILAIVRELLTNAYDSHKAAGKENIPIKINLPSYMEPNFIIRDYGIGLSKEDVMEMYTTFFSSTKSDSNDFTGCFGLGSKTPFSYTSSFSVNSYWNGTKYYFIATKKDGLPHIYAVREEPTDEPNGLEISIPTDKNGGYDSNFTYNMSQYLKYIPEIQIDCDTSITREEPILEKYGVRLYKYDQPYWDRTRLGQCHIKQGQNVYEIDKFIKEAKNVDILRHFLNYSHIVIEVPIGTLHITPSRESLSQDEQNSKKVFAYIEEINEKLKRAIVDDVDAFNIPNTGFMKMYNEIITKKYFSEHPLQVKITDFGECKIQHECGIHKVDATSISKDTISQTREGYVLLVPSSFNGKDINKLKNTINNYEELEDVNIYIAIPHGGRLDTSLLQLAKLLKATVWTLNNIPEYSFDIEYQTINQFYKKFTNHKRKRVTYNKNIQDDSDKNVRTKIKGIRLSDNPQKGYVPYHIGGNTIPVSVVKSEYNVDNTIIIYKDKNKQDESLSWDATKIFEQKVDIIKLFLERIAENSQNNFLLTFFQRLLPNLHNYNDIVFIEVSKTVKRHFKEYTTTSFDQIFDVIKEAEWFINKDLNSEVTDFILGCDEMLKCSFNEKTYNFITKTKTYNKLSKLNSLVKRKFKPSSYLDNYEIQTINMLIPNLLTEERKCYGISENVLLGKLKKLFSFWQESVSRNFHRYDNKTSTCENIQRKILSRKMKWETLLLLKGDL
jgi:hypothetical protein